MGLFDSGDQPNQSVDNTSALLNKQIQQNQTELSAKEQALYRQRIGIIRANGQQDFTGNNANKPVMGAPVGAVGNTQNSR